jgi:uncharacterized protein (TIGR00251 family)
MSARNSGAKGASGVSDLPYLAVQDGCLYLSIHVQPRASRTALCGVHGECLKLAITAPPVDGKANREVVNFLADLLGIARREIVIVSGLQSRTKRCRIGLLREEDVRKRIESAISARE